MTIFENFNNNSVGSDESRMGQAMAEVLQAFGNPAKPSSKDEMDCSADVADDNPETTEAEQEPHEDDGRSSIQREADKALEAIRSLGEALQKALNNPAAPMPKETGPAKDGDSKKSEPAPAPRSVPTNPSPEVAPPPRRVHPESAVTALEFGNIWNSPTA